MSLYNGPPRPGSRGGRDQFSWDNVKADKDREYYLGHSVKALAGRWQKGRDVYWYTREKSAQNAIQDEIQAVKQREEELMMEALGLKPKAAMKSIPQLDQHELNELIKGKQDEQEQPNMAEAAALEADRAKGLGYIAGTGGGLSEAVHTTLAGVGHGGLGANSHQPPRQAEPSGAAVPPAGSKAGAAVALAAGMAADKLKELRRAEKWARREAKKIKKEAKKSKKEARRRTISRREDDKPQTGGRKSLHRRSALGSSSSSRDGSSCDSDGDGRGGVRRSGSRRGGGDGRPQDRPPEAFDAEILRHGMDPVNLDHRHAGRGLSDAARGDPRDSGGWDNSGGMGAQGWGWEGFREGGRGRKQSDAGRRSRSRSHSPMQRRHGSRSPGPRRGEGGSLAGRRGEGDHGHWAGGERGEHRERRHYSSNSINPDRGNNYRR